MATIYEREILSRVESRLGQGKVIVIYGARQVGKTTMVQAVISRHGGTSSLYLNCDEPDVPGQLSGRTSTALRAFLGRDRLVVLDEAQRVPSIGLTLKLLADNYPDLQVIATGSSSFVLAQGIKESLTGRKIEFSLYPLSVAELLGRQTELEFHRLLDRRLVYGCYPGVVTSDDPERVLREITGSYLYRDVLEYQGLRDPDLLRRLVQALAMQVGSEVSYNELGTLLGADKETIARYLVLLEEAFIVFRLPPLSRNLRQELGKLRKVYFYDLGIRNAVLNAFNPLEWRSDAGALWENFVICERMKLNHNRGRFVNSYFWRTYGGSELDLVEERDGRFIAFECKWGDSRLRVPQAFAEAYPGSEVHLVNRSNYLDYLR